MNKNEKHSLAMEYRDNYECAMVEELFGELREQGYSESDSHNLAAEIAALALAPYTTLWKTYQ